MVPNFSLNGEFWFFGPCLPLHEKPYFLFPNFLKRWSFQQNHTGIWYFLYHQERWYFFSPKIWSCSLDGKSKMVFLIKNTWKYDSSSNLPKGSPSKDTTPEYDLSCIIRKDDIFFSGKYYIFSKRKAKDDLFQETHGNMMFPVYSVKMAFLFPTNMKLPFCQKSKSYLLLKNILSAFPASLKNGCSS